MGYAENGQLGLEIDVVRCIGLANPKSIPLGDKNAHKIFCGVNCSAITTTDGRIYLFGKTLADQSPLYIPQLFPINSNNHQYIYSFIGLFPRGYIFIVDRRMTALIHCATSETIDDKACHELFDMLKMCWTESKDLDVFKAYEFAVNNRKQDVSKLGFFNRPKIPPSYIVNIIINIQIIPFIVSNMFTGFQQIFWSLYAVERPTY
jgi:hypothetical protein